MLLSSMRRVFSLDDGAQTLYVIDLLRTTRSSQTVMAISSAVLRHRPARPGPRAPRNRGAPRSQKYIFNLVKNG